MQCCEIRDELCGVSPGITSKSLSGFDRLARAPFSSVFEVSGGALALALALALEELKCLVAPVEGQLFVIWVALLLRLVDFFPQGQHVRASENSQG